MGFSFNHAKTRKNTEYLFLRTYLEFVNTRATIKPCVAFHVGEPNGILTTAIPISAAELGLNQLI
jgi:hypothetical protein